MSIDLTTLEAGIALITINRPEKRNAFDTEHYEALSLAWQRVRDNAAVRAVIITGAGDKAFSAGADLKSDVGRAVP
ncbi:MAG: enoyl-CoA hydratase/isomerase family protein, partial [Burkholderiaceae bacterium]|nr:enoyl-CoA hydratase/isomerase family protein [Burkholderiaceae bacterium]